MSAKQRDLGIDILKFLAVICVVNSHMDVCYPGKWSVLATGGAIGDALFFSFVAVIPCSLAGWMALCRGSSGGCGGYFPRRYFVSELLPLCMVAHGGIELAASGSFDAYLSTMWRFMPFVGG